MVSSLFFLWFFSVCKSTISDVYSLTAWSDYGFPFQKIIDSSGRTIMGVLSAPLYKEQISTYYDIKIKGYEFLGISSYGAYPIVHQEETKKDVRSAMLINAEMMNIVNDIRGWLYCNNDTSLLPNVPRLFFSQSDAPSHYSRAALKNVSKEYDVVMSFGGGGDWHKWRKGWYLGYKCIQKMVEKGWRVLIFGIAKEDYENDPLLENPLLTFYPFSNYYEYIDLVEKSRIFFLPNVLDASPRVITEALVRNVPVVMNADIFGGWKYVNENTGLFFHDETDVIEKIEYVLSNHYSTRNWFFDHYYDGDVSLANRNLTVFVEDIMTTVVSEKQQHSLDRYEDFVDAILYINLENRSDRNKHMLNEFEKMNISQHLIHRIDAVENKQCGHLGCTDSHIKAMDYAKEKGFKRFMILEDDVYFTMSSYQFLSMLKTLYTHFVWDVFMLHTAHVSLKNTSVDYFKRIQTSTSGAGYIVNEHYFDTLYSNFVQGRSLLSDHIEKVAEEGKKIFDVGLVALDQNWFPLQRKDLFFVRNPLPLQIKSSLYSTTMSH